MADTEREEAFRRHEPERFGADAPSQKCGVLLERISLRYLERRPEPVVRTGRRGIGRADDHVPGERIDFGHIFEGRIEPVGRNLPRDERAVREIRREQRLSHATNRTVLEHRSNARLRYVEIDPGAARDLAERIAQETRDPIFRNLENFGVDRIFDVYRGREGCHA
jgi:hypothetical protein